MNFTGLFYFFGLCLAPVLVISLINIIFCFYFNYYFNIESYIIVFILVFFIFIFSLKIKPKKKEINKFELLIFALLIYFIIPLFTSIPFFYGNYLNFFASYFESISGFSSVGVSLLNNVYFLDEPIILWRSIIQWLGGFYFLLLLISIFGQEIFEFFPMKFLQKEKDTNYFHLNFLKNLKNISYVYLILTLLIFIILNFTNYRLFEVVNLVFSIVSGGGFLGNKIIADNDFDKFLLSVSFLLSSINIFFLLIILKINKQFSLSETKSILIFLITMMFVILVNDKNLGFFDIMLSLTSSISNSGLYFGYNQNINIFFLLITVFVGGSLLSNSGGFKITRFLIIFKNILSEFSKLLIPASITNLSIYNSSEKIKSSDLFISSLVLFTYFLMMILYCFFLSFENISFENIFKISFLVSFNTLPSSLYGINGVNFSNFNNLTLLISLIVFVLSKITPLSFILLIKNFLLR